jgi:3D (Asp-Asp-Asp) domain-containing protein
MRIIRLAVVLLVACAVIFPQMASASETATIDTNINIDFSKISNFLFPAAALADENQAPAIETEQSSPAKEVAKSEDDIRDEAIFAQWKDKQADKWENLPKDKFVINASAYTASADECGNSKGITASGFKVKENRTIACPQKFPFGLKIEIEGIGTLTCEDRGGAIKGNKIDIYMLTKKEAKEFGRQNLMAQVVEG